MFFQGQLRGAGGQGGGGSRVVEGRVGGRKQ